MPNRSACTTAFVAMVLGLCSACSSPPTVYPRFEASQARPALVVGTIEDAEYLDEFPECSRREAFCMDPPPVLLTVDVTETVYGPELRGWRYVATTSHYGKSQFAAAEGDLQLFPLTVHDQDLVLPRNARAGLGRTTDGDLAIPDWGHFPIWWLPCSVMELREPLDFTGDSARRTEWLELDKLGGLVRVYGDKALPLYGLRLSRIASHLSGLNPGVADMKCERRAR